MEESLGARVRRIRKDKRLPLRVVASQADISVAYLSKIERNEANPTIDVLERLVGVFNMTLNELTAGLKTTTELAEDMPESLKQFIYEYKDKFPHLLEPDWQNMLLGVRLRGRYPTRSEDWLMIFLEAQRAFE
ncbi:MAG TPA: helix-turn-helix transcriptional regulator [Leptolyngbyaceae cyanobacterium]